MTRPHLFTPEGDFATQQILARNPLLALDFDGTLAPIVARPEQARAPVAVARALQQIATQLPVAIITGRSIADVKDRLGFEPHYIVGNHGAEGLPENAEMGARHTVQQWRQLVDSVHGEGLRQAGVMVEDKGLSLSLHYRLARDRERALEAIAHFALQLDPLPRQIGGKCVLNLLPEDAPDKYVAVSRLLALEKLDCAIFLGDDVTDEIVFTQAPADWLTVRIELMEHSKARFFLRHQSEVAMFLQRLSRSMALRPAFRQEATR